MHCGRAIHLFRRLTTGDTRLNITSTTNVSAGFYDRFAQNEQTRFVRNSATRSLLPTALKIRTMSSKNQAADSSRHKHTNRLSLEKSPYLLQHAHNPVDWYPWGTEAFEKAKADNKLIFLSVGYSTCHWCHVMEKESFENEDVAAIMNEYFVNIKVDREERPDIDKIYMTFIQATTGGGGWPMSVFLTPDLNPVTGGTYFPPEDKWGRPGFKTILRNLGVQWTQNSADLTETGTKILEVLTRATKFESSVTNSETNIPSPECGARCIQQFIRNYEPEFGGFGAAPKFPQPVNLNFLFHAYARNKKAEEASQCLEMCLYTLRRMAKGGIHDHVSSGFARYSVDEKWHVPHFEKMLYDQAQLAVSYSDAYLATQDEQYAEVVRDILTYVSRDLSHPEGGFYSAEDADSLPTHESHNKEEGAFCVWEKDEIVQHLQDKKLKNVSYSDIFCHHFNVLPNGNVSAGQDPHGELKNKNVLIILGSAEATADKFGITVPDLNKVIKECIEILYQVRQKRPRPHLDSKIICSWNGLMISGYSRASEALDEPSYLERADQCARFIKKHMYDEKDKTLLRSSYRNEDGKVAQIQCPIAGFLDDYAFLIRGLLDLYEASLNRDWLQWARELQDTQDRLFLDQDAGGYYTSPEGDPSVVMRLKEDQDGAEPSGNSVSVHNLLRLAAHLDCAERRACAQKVLTAFAHRLERVPVALPEMASALLTMHDEHTQILIAGGRDDPRTQALLKVVRAQLIPGRVLSLAADPSSTTATTSAPGGSAPSCPLTSKLRPLGPHCSPAAYVCRTRACSLPVTEPGQLAALLGEESENLRSEKE